MRRQEKVGVYQTKIPERVLKTCFASRRNERRLGINEEFALLSPSQWRFEVDRMQSRFASSVDYGPCQPAKFWKKSFVYYLLKSVALIGLRGHGRGSKRRRRENYLVAAAPSKIPAGWRSSYGRLAKRFFYVFTREGAICVPAVLASKVLSRCRTRTRPLNKYYL